MADNYYLPTLTNPKPSRLPTLLNFLAVSILVLSTAFTARSYYASKTQPPGTGQQPTVQSSISAEDLKSALKALGLLNPDGTFNSELVKIAPCPQGKCVSLQETTPGTVEAGNINISGSLTAGSLQGEGSGVYDLNAGNIVIGRLRDRILSANVPLKSTDNTFTGFNLFNGSVTLGDSSTDTLTLNATTAINTLGTTNTTSYLCRNSSNQLALCSLNSIGAAFIQGGNAFGSTATLGTTDNNPLNLITNNTTRLTVDTSGQIGVGTTTPVVDLHVVNDQVNAQMILETYGSTPVSEYIGRRALGSLASPLAVTTGSILGRFAGQGYDGTQFTSSRAALEFVASQNWNTTSNGTIIKLYTTPDGSTSRQERLRVDQAGNVGIGDTAPDFKLDAAGDIRIQGSNKLYFGGTGAADNDTNLYRYIANTLATDDDFIVGDSVANGALKVNGAAGNTRDIQFTTSITPRWILRANSSAETGSNAGSDFELMARDDTGAILSSPISITRSTGQVIFNNATSSTGAVRFGTDTNLYRSAADTLKTDDSLHVARNTTAADGVTIDVTTSSTSWGNGRGLVINRVVADNSYGGIGAEINVTRSGSLGFAQGLTVTSPSQGIAVSAGGGTGANLLAGYNHAGVLSSTADGQAFTGIQNSTANNALLYTYNNTADIGDSVYVGRSRGTAGTPLMPASGDKLGGLGFSAIVTQGGFNNQTEIVGSAIRSYLTATPTASAASADLRFYTNNASGTPTQVMKLNSNGSALFQNSANSTTAFQIQNAAGTSNLFNADTTNSRIGIGTVSPQEPLHIIADGSGNALRIERSSGAIMNLQPGTTVGFIGTSNLTHLDITTNNLSRLRVESDGDVNFDSNTLFVDATNNRVGIGTATPNYGLQINGTQGFTIGSSYRKLATPTNFGYDTGQYKVLMLGSTSTSQLVDDGAVTISLGYNPSANTNSAFTGDGREVLVRNLATFMQPNSGDTGYLNTLTLSNGNTGFGTTNFSGSSADATRRFYYNSAGGYLWNTQSGTEWNSYWLRDNTSGGFATFYYQSTNTGSITTSTTNTAYNTSSDQRLKENIVQSGSGLSTLLQIPVRDFNFVSDPSKTQQGFIAQELYNIYPDAVKMGGDDPSKDPWQIDYGRLTPLLVKSIQDLNTKVDNLQTNNSTFTDINVGNLATVKKLVVTESIETVDLYVNGHLLGNGDTNGEVVVAAGQDVLAYTFAKPFTGEPTVVLTPKQQLAGLNYWVTSDENGFTVHLSGVAPSELKFNYFVIGRQP